jgi:hypothetical protein
VLFGYCFYEPVKCWNFLKRITELLWKYLGGLITLIVVIVVVSIICAFVRIVLCIVLGLGIGALLGALKCLIDNRFIIPINEFWGRCGRDIIENAAAGSGAAGAAETVLKKFIENLVRRRLGRIDGPVPPILQLIT